MSGIEWFSSPTWQRVGLALLHFLWQGAAVALAMGGMIHLLRLRHGLGRHGLYLAGLVSMAACPIATFLIVEAPVAAATGSAPAPGAAFSDGPPLAEPSQGPAAITDPQPAAPPPARAAAAATRAAPLRETISHHFRRALPWATAGWLLGVSAMGARMLLGFAGVHRWRRRLAPLPPELDWRVGRLARRLGLPQTPPVRVSFFVPEAATVGYLRPMVLVPAAMLTQMPTEMLEALIAHELAHVRRLDPLVNLLQRVAEALLFYHPGVWWVSGRLRREREFCCDELAVGATGESVTYASALERAGQMALPAHEAAPAVRFARRRGAMLARVRHVLGMPVAPRRPGCRLAGAVALAAVVALAATVPISYSFGRPLRPSKAAPAAAKTARVLHFPKDRSLGTLRARDASETRRIRAFCYWEDRAQWKYYADATGDVAVEPGKRIALYVRSRSACSDLSPLRNLRTDDLHTLALWYPGADDRCMPHVAKLTGLKVLNLKGTNVSDKGLRLIQGLKSLERLELPNRVTNAGIAHVAKLKSLKGLYFSMNQVTNAGLAHLAKLPRLEELALCGPRMDNAALAHLAKLPCLRYLLLFGPTFNSGGLAHLQKVPSLRILVCSGIKSITDAGAPQLAKLANLERLSLYDTGITDRALVHLGKLRSLKMLDIGKTKVTDAGLPHLAAMTALEHLQLPNSSITDAGLAHLPQLRKLKYLWVGGSSTSPLSDEGLKQVAKLRSLEALEIGGTGITDAGMDEIAKLTHLEELSIFTAPCLTDEGLAKLAALKSLQKLFVQSKNVTVAGLANLNALPRLTYLRTMRIRQDGSGLDIAGLAQLEDLSLTLTPVSDDDLACLAELTRLRWLQAGFAAVSDKGMAHLAGLTRIERLTIGGANLTDDGLVHLANMSRLNQLTIKGNITDEGLRYLEPLQALRVVRIVSPNRISPAAQARLRRKLPRLYFLRVRVR